MSESSDTIAGIIRSRLNNLTRAERQLTNSLLESYPVSGLGSVTTVAEAADISTPTAVRLVRKLGFKDYPEFQPTLRAELEATISNPIAKHDRWAASVPDTHMLNQFASAVITNIQQSLNQIDIEVFDAIVALLADRKLNMSRGDVLVVFDIRRYEHGLLNLSELARMRRDRRSVQTNGHSQSPSTRNTSLTRELRRHQLGIPQP